MVQLFSCCSNTDSKSYIIIVMKLDGTCFVSSHVLLSSLKGSTLNLQYNIIIIIIMIIIIMIL